LESLYIERSSRAGAVEHGWADSPQRLSGRTRAVILAITSQILDQIPQLSAIHEYLPTHYWLAFADLLRDPIATGDVGSGLASAAAYTVIFFTAAWARFGGRDVTS
jgi:ABC-2 type transport system permease protein